MKDEFRQIKQDIRKNQGLFRQTDILSDTFLQWLIK